MKQLRPMNAAVVPFATENNLLRDFTIVGLTI
jgi:hypothetical protein